MSNCPAITDEPLWDRVTVLSTTSPMRLQLFQVPHGNYDPYESYCTQPKGRADTSMYQHGGRLGGNESFTVEAIELSLDDAATYPPGAPDSDVAKLWALAHFELRTENDRALVFSAPLASVRGNKVRWNLKRKIHIDRGEGFGAAINFSRAPSLSRDRKVMCVLYGDHYMVPVHAQGFADGKPEPFPFAEDAGTFRAQVAALTQRCDSLEAILAERFDRLEAKLAKPVEAPTVQARMALAVLDCSRCGGDLHPIMGHVDGAAVCLTCWLAAQPKRCEECREPCGELDVAERDGELLTCVACWERRAAGDAKRVLAEAAGRAKLARRIEPYSPPASPKARRLTTARLAQLVSMATLAGLGFSAAVAKVVMP